ncbi:hypothetical protein PR048_004336 [Dryococelus australis]|uniref:Uncharacterized protein n=1 Tax=Dryococelus australis TaxID=614101 RepID=A0ABQ9I552_9NEOP|nr:hypothetical protein PR048_004336 [Dryococelus australis]
MRTIFTQLGNQGAISWFYGVRSTECPCPRLDLTNCVSQSFDGASVMSGALNRVQALMRHMANNLSLHWRNGLHQFACFDIIILLVCLDDILSTVNSLSLYLQSPNLNFGRCLKLIESKKE